MTNTFTPTYIYPPFINNSKDYHRLPSIPKITETGHEDTHPIQDTFTLFYIESKDTICLKAAKYSISSDFISVSSPYQAIFNTYTYFLFFTRLNQQSHRYGLYFNPKGLSLLEIKLTLYTLNHHPLELKILKRNGEVLINQLCFNHINFCFYLDWTLCKHEELIVQMYFIRNYTYQFDLKFQDFLYYNSKPLPR